MNKTKKHIHSFSLQTGLCDCGKQSHVPGNDTVNGYPSPCYVCGVGAGMKHNMAHHKAYSKSGWETEDGYLFKKSVMEASEPGIILLQATPPPKPEYPATKPEWIDELRTRLYRTWYTQMGSKTYPVNEFIVCEELEDFIQTQINKQITKAKEEVIEEVEDYLEHNSECILSLWSAGRPTVNGYEAKYGGKWYQISPIDKRPKCDCGLDYILSALKSKL